MSYCKVHPSSGLTEDQDVLDLELLLVSENFTAQFVTQDQYNHLMFILGQKTSTSFEPSFYHVLNLFKDFHTRSEDNFKEMLEQLQLPFVYDSNKSLAQNRHDFKDFFSCLTNI